MNKKSQLVWGIILFIGLIAGAALGYHYLIDNYKKDNISTQTETPEAEQKILAPDFTVYDEAGNTVKLSDYKGKPVVLNFWASWCPPCRAEMPYFNEASKTYAEEDIAILMINLTDGQRETKDIAVQYMKDNNYEMKLLLDSDGNAANTYQISSIPTTLLIDRAGYIVEAYKGSIEESTLKGGIEKILEDK